MQEQWIIFGAKYLFAVIALVFVVFVLKQEKVKRRNIFFISLCALPAVYIVAKIGSALYFDPRPFVTGNFTPLIAHSADNGFPSDHTLFSAALASVLLLFHRKLGWLLFVLAFLVGMARVLAGVHSWVDIIGSLVIAFTVTNLVNRAIMRYGKSLCNKDFGNN